MDKDIEKLQQMIDGSRRIVFFGGAGVSTESGIPDFRSVDGLYHQIYTAPLTPDMTLESIWEKFNIDHPKDFKGHSLSKTAYPRRVGNRRNNQNAARYFLCNRYEPRTNGSRRIWLSSSIR